jgi:anti-sigma factor RsiW
VWGGWHVRSIPPGVTGRRHCAGVGLLPWPAGEPGRESASLTVRGFNVLLWRDPDLGYALVSDLNAADLRALGTRLAAP